MERLIETLAVSLSDRQYAILCQIAGYGQNEINYSLEGRKETLTELICVTDNPMTVSGEYWSLKNIDPELWKEAKDTKVKIGNVIHAVRLDFNALNWMEAHALTLHLMQSHPKLTYSLEWWLNDVYYTTKGNTIRSVILKAMNECSAKKKTVDEVKKH